MSFYPAEVNERSISPRRAGAVDGANAESTSASFVCGSFATVSLRIDPVALLITDAGFQTNGCGFMTAAAEVLCESLLGRTLGDLHGLPEDELMQLVAGELGEFPPGRVQCGAVVFEALRTALAKYRSRRIEEFQGEKALVCTCFGVSEETLIETISAHRLKDVNDVGRLCHAGTGCGSCRMLIQELIDAVELESGYS